MATETAWLGGESLRPRVLDRRRAGGSRPHSVAEGGRGGVRRLLLLFMGASLFLALGACATIPRSALPQGAALTSLLPANDFAYVALKVARNAGFVTDVLKESGLARSIPASFVGKTKELYAAVEAPGTAKPVFALVASGDYPATLIQWRLSWSATWRRQSGSVPWWQNRAEGTQISVPSPALLMFSNGALPSMLDSLTKGGNETLDPQVLGLFNQADLAAYFPKVRGNLPLFGGMANRVPVDSLYLAMNSEGSSGSSAAGGGYRGYVVFRMKNERDARLFSVVFKLLIAGANGGSRIGGFSIPLAGARLGVDGSLIRIEGITIGDRALASLFADVITGTHVGRGS